MALKLNLNLAIVGTILAAVVGLLLISGFLPSLFSSTASVTENLSTSSTGNDQADTIKDVFTFVVPVIIVIAIVGLVLGVAQFRGKN